jgi:hypothetical protein
MIPRTLLAVLSTFAVTDGAFAQESAQEGWDWQFAPYLWSSGITGDVRLGNIERDIDIKFSDIVDHLAGGVLLHLEGRSGDNGLFGDLIYLSLEPENEIATVGGVTEAEFNTTILEAGYLRAGSKIGLEFGVRYWDFEVVLDPATLPRLERNSDWVDGFVGIRTERPLGQNWSWQSRINVGAGGSDSTFGLQSIFSRELSSGNSLIFGLKTLLIDYKNDEQGLPYELDTTFAGATIGFMFD